MSKAATIVVETLQQHEKEQYARILLESYQQYESVYPTKEAWEQYARAITASVYAETVERTLVAKIDGEMVGGLHLFVDGEKAYNRPELNIESTIIRLLGVHPNGRGKGVAKRLLEESIAFARERGDTYVYLHSTNMMAEAIALYKKLGFVADPSRNFEKNQIVVQCFRYLL